MNTATRNGGNSTHAWVCKRSVDLRSAGVGGPQSWETGAGLGHVSASLWGARTRRDLGEQGQDDSGSGSHHRGCLSGEAGGTAGQDSRAQKAAPRQQPPTSPLDGPGRSWTRRLPVLVRGESDFVSCHP